MKSSEALVKAIQAGDLKQVQSIINQEPALSGYVTESGIPVSLLAAYYQKQDIFEWIMSKRDNPGIYEAAAAGLEEQIQLLLTENPGQINDFAPDGFTALGLACYFNRFPVVKLLVDHGANVNLAANNGARVAPLHSAVAANSIDITRLLLEHGAGVNAIQQGGVTALHSAAHRGNAAMVKLLLEYGATPGLKTDDGKTALDFAQADGHEAVVQLLT